ncbi:MAG: hypothetical protein V1806_15280 [Pseudomonadota bacterium]
MEYHLEAGISIQVAWPLAAREASAAGFEQIGNVHLLLGLLKLAELPGEQLARLADSQRLEELRLERGELRGLLGQRGLRVPEDTTGIRHTLRKSLGRGAASEGRRGLHRSQAARQSCRLAALAALERGEPTWRGLHLLETLLGQEDQLIRGTLLAAASGGQDFAGRALAQAPALKVLARGLGGAPARAMVLLRQDGPSPDSLLRALPGYLSQGLHGGAAVARQVVELDLASLEVPALCAALAQAAQDGGRILFLRGLAALWTRDLSDPLAGALADWLKNPQAPCVAEGDSGLWAALDDSSAWRRCLAPVWLHQVALPEML